MVNALGAEGVAVGARLTSLRNRLNAGGGRRLVQDVEGEPRGVLRSGQDPGMPAFMAVWSLDFILREMGSNPRFWYG